MSGYELTLKNKVAIVTGAARGIGREISLVFARAGASVAVVDIDLLAVEEAVKEIKKINRRVLGIKTNVADKEEVDAMVDKVVEKFGTVDILVNNAGKDLPVSLMNLREDGWDKTFDVNVKSCYLCTQAAGKIMVKKKAGSIINIASGAGILADKTHGAYCASKAAVIQLSRAFAAELASDNVRVNCVLPGLIRSRMTQAVHQHDKILKNYVRTTVPLGRIGEPGDIAVPVLFLASEASNYMTGSAMLVDGGSAITGQNHNETANLLSLTGVIPRTRKK